MPSHRRAQLSGRACDGSKVAEIAEARRTRRRLDLPPHTVVSILHCTKISWALSTERRSNDTTARTRPKLACTRTRGGMASMERPVSACCAIHPCRLAARHPTLRHCRAHSTTTTMCTTRATTAGACYAPEITTMGSDAPPCTRSKMVLGGLSIPSRRRRIAAAVATQAAETTTWAEMRTMSALVTATHSATLHIWQQRAATRHEQSRMDRPDCRMARAERLEV